MFTNAICLTDEIISSTHKIQSTVFSDYFFIQEQNPFFFKEYIYNVNYKTLSLVMIILLFLYQSYHVDKGHTPP